MTVLFRRLLAATLLLLLSAPLLPFLGSAWYALRLARMAEPAAYAMPVAGVRRAALRDVWQAPRDGGRRRHEGIDIFARRGTPVQAATEGIVLHVGRNRLGGNVVWVLGPGGQRHYYAHLERYGDVAAGMRVAPGAVLGYVGTTGNARGTPPHLHYGIYTRGGAIDPYPLLRREDGVSPAPALARASPARTPAPAAGRPRTAGTSGSPAKTATRRPAA
jgi:murein DD-endopeptidase MepM/ murein hydrolase activator NlpD